MSSPKIPSRPPRTRHRRPAQARVRAMRAAERVHERAFASPSGAPAAAQFGQALILSVARVALLVDALARPSAPRAPSQPI